MTAFDPVTFGLDVMHGKRETNLNSQDASGWFAAADVSYKMDMLTASLVAFTSTGEDSSAGDGSEVMPVLSNGNGAFAPTTFGTDGDWNMGAGNILTAGPGAQGVGLKLTGLSFLENLTHVINVFYFRGTSDKEAAASLAGGWTNTSTFTSKDSAFEVNFESEYAIYENLSAVLDLSFVGPGFRQGRRGAHRRHQQWPGRDRLQGLFPDSVQLLTRFLHGFPANAATAGGGLVRPGVLLPSYPHLPRRSTPPSTVTTREPHRERQGVACSVEAVVALDQAEDKPPGS